MNDSLKQILVRYNIMCTRIHRLDGSAATKAFADISVMDILIIKGLRIVESSKGLFVAMPREAGKDGKWYITVIPLTKDVKDAIEALVLETYYEET